MSSLYCLQQAELVYNRHYEIKLKQMFIYNILYELICFTSIIHKQTIKLWQPVFSTTNRNMNKIVLTQFNQQKARTTINQQTQYCRLPSLQIHAHLCQSISKLCGLRRETDQDSRWRFKKKSSNCSAPRRFFNMFHDLFRFGPTTFHRGPHPKRQKLQPGAEPSRWWGWTKMGPRVGVNKHIPLRYYIITDII